MAGTELFPCEPAHSLSFRHSFAVGPPRLVSSYPGRPGLEYAKLSRLRLRVLAMASKRNPKRLKYSAPRLSKVDDLVYVEVDPSGKENWKLEPLIELLNQGAVGVIPTDTVYAIVCHFKSYSAIDRLRSHLASYAAPFETSTLIIQWGSLVVAAKVMQIFSELLSIACLVLVKRPKENEWMIDPVVIADIYGQEGLDFVVDGGVRVVDPSTVVDMTKASLKIVRLGKGPKLQWMVKEEDNGSTVSADKLTPSTT
ncbi:hypothetical protein V6N12_021504 [Hibiscus sabdariffa]|uniref:Threonylcarbamoyl-AMP synthase n=1 Tax=Hibiscus sabdariffa TaxID=183260 RepID=A0ABR2FRU9_9ROSI